MMDLVIDALKDTLAAVPFLIITFILIEFIEHKYGKNFDEKIKISGKLGPIIGGLLGIIPQCGFSVMGVAFYSQGYITLGTLISIFVATSDEALPVLISTPGSISKVLPFILVKLIFAIIWGYVVDIIFGKLNLQIDRIHEETKDGCCGEECIYNKFNIKEIIHHSIERAVKIAGYIAVITLFINILLNGKSVETFTGGAAKFSYLSIITSSIIGLIPNCAVSVGLVEVYLHGALGFPGLIAGLSSNAGLALLVLFKEVKDRKKPIYILLILLSCSILTGIILQAINFSL